MQCALDQDGIIVNGQFIASPNHDPRPDGTAITMIVIHNISLPPGEYGGPGIVQLFTNTLRADDHPYYAGIHQLKVSSHFLIRRDGQLIQFVAGSQRAWHAGVSHWQGRDRCNDFSIGIELEGSDVDAFKAAQYTTLNALIRLLQTHYPISDIVGHSEIAPGRKTDPGPYFDWSKVESTPQQAGKIP